MNYFPADDIAAFVISTMRVFTSLRLSAARGKGSLSFPDCPSLIPTTTYIPSRSTAEIWADTTWEFHGRRTREVGGRNHDHA